MKTWWIYILRCRDGSLYTGITTDLVRRLAEHSAGKASRYTRSRLPVVKVWHAQCSGRSDALRCEALVKSLPRVAKLALLGVRFATPSSCASHD